MFGAKKRWQQEKTDLLARIEHLGEVHKEAEQGWEKSRRLVVELKVQAAEQEATIKRLAGRNNRLQELLELARLADRDDDFDQVLARLERALRGCARYRAQLATAGAVDDPRGHARALEARLHELQQANMGCTCHGQGTASEPMAVRA